MTEEKQEYKIIEVRRSIHRNFATDKARPMFTRDQNPAAFALWDAESRPFGETFSMFARKLLEEISKKKLENLGIAQPSATVDSTEHPEAPLSDGEHPSTTGPGLFDGI